MTKLEQLAEAYRKAWIWEQKCRQAHREAVGAKGPASEENNRRIREFYQVREVAARDCFRAAEALHRYARLTPPQTDAKP